MNTLQRCPVCSGWTDDLIGHMCEHAPDALVTTILAIVQPPMTITTNISPTPPQDATDAGDGVTPASRPAEASLVALDAQIHAAERIVLARVDDLIGAFDPEAVRQMPDFWTSLGLLGAAEDELKRIEGLR